jgi:hypothetical protein
MFPLELKYEDVYSVWETIWAANHVVSTNFSLFVGLAIIELYRLVITVNKSSSNWYWHFVFMEFHSLVNLFFFFVPYRKSHLESYYHNRYKKKM